VRFDLCNDDPAAARDGRLCLVVVFHKIHGLYLLYLRVHFAFSRFPASMRINFIIFVPSDNEPIPVQNVMIINWNADAFSVSDNY
jgi:hypothetical protein